MAKQKIGDFLATLRKANGYTQQEVANRLGISNRTLSGWECNNVLPDILLLPALGELYGVTVDEILAGERRERNDIALSSKSEKKIYKSKIARFTVQCWILLGVLISGILIVAVSAYIEVTQVSWTGFPWWRVLLVGLAPVVVCMAILVAFWKGAEMSVDDTSDGFAAYCIVLRRKLANCLYLLAATNIVATIVVAIGLFVRNSVHFAGVVACAAFGVAAIALFLTGWFLYKNALIKWGGENARHILKRDSNFFWATDFWGIFPVVLSVIVAIVLGCVQFEQKTTIYENDSVEEFVKHMETLEELGVEKHFPLSELAKTAKPGDEFDLGDGYKAVYRLLSFTIINEHIMQLQGGEDGLTMVPFSFEVPQIFLTDEHGTFVFYNVRYWYDFENDTNSNMQNRYVKYDRHGVERVGNGMAYIHEVAQDYSLIGYAVAFAVITADLVVCAVLCIRKRYQHIVKL